jgi:hypothetical protein
MRLATIRTAAGTRAVRGRARPQATPLPAGRQVPAAEVPWMQVREAWIHGADFADPMTFANIPRTWPTRSSATSPCYGSAAMASPGSPSKRSIPASARATASGLSPHPSPTCSPGMAGRGSKTTIRFDGSA